MKHPDQIIRDFRSRYIRRQILFYSLLLVSFSAVLAAFYGRWLPGTGGTGVLLTAGILGTGWLIRQMQRVQHISLATVCRHLNRTRPELEESCLLALKPAKELNPLERLQLHRIGPALVELNPRQALPVSLKKAWITLTLSALASAFIFLVPDLPALPASPVSRTLAPPATEKVRERLPQIKGITIRVAPPAYTGIAPYSVSQPSFRAEAGAIITWEIQTSMPITSLLLSRPEKQPLSFRPRKNQPGTYVLSLVLPGSFLYTLDLNESKSDFYAVELIKDQAPVITIQKPTQYTEVAFGDPQRVLVSAVLTDDYGLQKASLVATVAKGSGEAVKFQEVHMPLALHAAGQGKTSLIRESLDLKALDLTYGDELYFYLQAQDNHRGYARSETYFVQLEDTSVVTDGADRSMPVSVVPAYFRSQRQLILDTEKLLREKRSLAPALFRDRANDLAADQKLLRLRYGKFLGEEAETVIGPNGPGKEEAHRADDGHDHGPATEEQNTPVQLLDAYLHKHDTEEDATYFEPAVKAQLKAALAQMWEAELRLRLSQPEAALPFEYKALRLLKEVQQKSRAYVRKMGFNPPPLEEKKKRLTGERDKITAPANREDRQEKPQYPYIRLALPWLAAPAVGGRVSARERAQLQGAGQELAQAALQDPGEYLKTLQDLRQLLQEIKQGHITCQPCRIRVAGAFEGLLPWPLPAPGQKKRYPHPLADQYFKRLK